MKQKPNATLARRQVVPDFFWANGVFKRQRRTIGVQTRVGVLIEIDRNFLLKRRSHLGSLRLNARWKVSAASSVRIDCRHSTLEKSGAVCPSVRSHRKSCTINQKRRLEAATRPASVAFKAASSHGGVCVDIQNALTEPSGAINFPMPGTSRPGNSTMAQARSVASLWGRAAHAAKPIFGSTATLNA